MESNRKLSASCVVIKDNEVLLVKHTYGAAKGKYLIPGGFSEEYDEATFMPVDEALRSDNVVDTTKEILKSMLRPNKSMLEKSDFVNARFDSSTWQIFM